MVQFASVATCDYCNASFTAANQYSMCPSCGTVKGTSTRSEADLTRLLSKFVRWFEDWESATQTPREWAETARDYYDGNQWTETELAKLKDRNQPPIVINRIAKKINYLLGDEVANRADPKAFPRVNSQDDDAYAVTDSIRYVCDDQDADRIFSINWEERIIEGIEACVVEIEKRPCADNDDKEYQAAEEKTNDDIYVTLRLVHWDRLWWDHHSREEDFSDAAYRGIHTWMDLEDAKEMMASRGDAVPNYEEVLDATLGNQGVNGTTHSDRPQGWSENKSNRPRVRIAEVYYQSEGQWNVAFYTKAGFLVEPKPTGYLDEEEQNVCPLRMGSAFVNRSNWRYGLVKNMLSPQDEINKRRSKSLHLFSTRQVWAEEGAVIDEQKAQTEAAKPDGWVKLQPGALKDGRIIDKTMTEMAQGQLQLLSEAKAEIDTVGPDASPAMEAGESGRSRQMQLMISNRELARLYDGHKRYKREVYEHIWYAIRQFKTEEFWMRVSDDTEKTGFRFVAINRPMTRGQRFQDLMQKGAPPPSALEGAGLPRDLMDQVQPQIQQITQMAQQQGQQVDPNQVQQLAMSLVMRLPMMQEPFTAHDVAKLKMDIVLDESEDTTILQQEEREDLAQLIPSFLQAQVPPVPLLQMVIESSQLRNKKKLLEMLEPKQDPQAAQMQQMMQQMQQTLQQIQLEQAKANVTVAQTQAELNHAKALQAEGQAQTEPMKAQAAAQADSAIALTHAANAGATVAGA